MTFQLQEFTEADIVTAFDKSTVGTKVVNEATFMWALNQALEKHDPSGDWAPGQHKVVLPESAYESVSAGEGPASDNPRDYHIRLHRGKPSMFLKREKAGKVTSLECIVYTLEAYAADPEVSAVEFTRVRNWGNPCHRCRVGRLWSFHGPVPLPVRLQPGRR